MAHNLSGQAVTDAAKVLLDRVESLGCAISKSRRPMQHLLRVLDAAQRRDYLLRLLICGRRMLAERPQLAEQLQIHSQ